MTLPKILVLFALFSVVSACSDDADNEQTPVKGPHINVVQANDRQLIETITVSGTLVPREDVRITAQVEGLAVTEIRVDEGDKIKKGQILAKLDDIALKAQLAQNAANIARAEATNAEAQKSLSRVQTIMKSGYSSQAALDQSLRTARVAEAERGAVLAQRDELQARVARSEIKSPVDGVVSQRLARVGMIAAATAPLFTLIEKGQVELEGEVADTQHQMIKAGQLARIFVAGDDEAIGGAVRLVSPRIDETTRLGRIRVTLLTDAVLPIGGYGRAIIETARLEAISVPLSSISYSQSGASVQLVVDNVVKTQKVEPGIIASGYAEIKSGLNRGDMVVVRAGTFLRDGDIISPLLAKPE